MKFLISFVCAITACDCCAIEIIFHRGEGKLLPFFYAMEYSGSNQRSKSLVQRPSETGSVVEGYFEQSKIECENEFLNFL